MKKIFNFFLCGMCTAFGYLTAVKVVEVCNDPIKKTKIKKKIVNIKDEIIKKD